MRRFANFAILIAGTLLGAMALPFAAQAQSVQSLGDYKAWSAYSTVRSATSICFIHSKPTAVEPEIEGIEQPYFYVTHRPSENVKYEMNLVAGFELGTDSLAKAKVGGIEYSMFTQGDAAWLEDPSLSVEMAAAMRRGNSMQVEAVDKQGARVTMTFSLSGATASMRKIDATC